MKNITVLTTNQGKIQEMKEILNIPFEFVSLEVDEVQSMDLDYVARKKAEEAYKKIGKPVIVDDVGVFIEAWDGFPGPFAKFILESLGNKRILKILENEKNRKVIVKSVIGYHDGANVFIFSGEVNGTLSFEELGNEGWGFDPIVIPDGETLTFAQMGPSGKNKISHRKKALDKFKQFLDSQKT